MDPLLIPLVAMASVVLIVAIVMLAKVRDKEVEVERLLYASEIEHRQRMKDIEQQLEQLRLEQLKKGEGAAGAEASPRKS